MPVGSQPPASFFIRCAQLAARLPCRPSSTPPSPTLRSSRCAIGPRFMIGLSFFDVLLNPSSRVGSEDLAGDYAALIGSGGRGGRGGREGREGSEGLGSGSGARQASLRKVFGRVADSYKMSTRKISRMVKKWQKAASKPERSYSNLDAEAAAQEAMAIPEGCVEIFVGREKRRYVISAEYLEREVIKRLIEKSKQTEGCEGKESDTDTERISVACEVVLFEHLLWLLKNADEVGSWYDPEADELADFYAY